ncbi:hypothetical protein NHX12_024795 [Muraenolepis orangiensis]|uniref:SAP domain-containing protein n=1 Tax=Muraenolepis orangiensis TaxID=630683 RepID=A0A9Q0EI58_9TELE|nr:hypothetical protein NHX12_024795 [Muraenolepis orangiensis]
MELQASMGLLGGEGGLLGLLVPSPQSEAVTHELEELTLQPTLKLTPLNERKNVLQLRLQQRRTREQLVDQGIMPPLKSPAAFHGQIRSLERARTENFLKHKIRSRPERAELIRMHILQETGAEPSLQATQMRLKRARLADDLNEKISQRPGPMELVEKNILPVDSSVISQATFPKELDEDSGDPMSPEQPASQESHSSAPSPAETKRPETPSLPLTLVSQAAADFLKAFSTNEQLAILQAPPTALPITTAKPGPMLVKQSQSKLASEKSRSKKSKEPKSRVKKLKYHQYVPPDQKLEASETILPAPLKPVAEGQGGTSMPGVLPVNLEEMKVAELKMELKLRGLPVSGTKTDLMERLKPFQDSHASSPPSYHSSLPMELSNGPPAVRLPAQQKAPEGSAPPLVSPVCSELSSLRRDVARSRASPDPQAPSPGRGGLVWSHPVPEEKDRRLHEKERCTFPSVPTAVATAPAPTLSNSNPVKLEGRVLANRSSSNSVPGSPALANHLPTVVKLEDVTVCSGRPVHPQARTPMVPQVQLFSQIRHPGGPCLVSQGGKVLNQSQRSPNVYQRPQQPAPGLQQFFISHRGSVSQGLGQPQSLLAGSSPPTTRILLPVSLPGNPTSTTAPIAPPTPSVSLQPMRQATGSNPAPGLGQASLSHLQSSTMEMSPSQQRTNHSPLMQTLTMCNNTPAGLQNQNRPEVNPQCFLSRSPENRVSPRASPNHSRLPNGSPIEQTLHQHPESKEPPPRYEDAIKQSRNQHLNHLSQVPTATSQQMDDLFDILIESGEMTPFIHQDPQPSSLSKSLPVTASVTTLPVNTAFSRPPPQIQVAPPPAPGPLSDHGLSSLASDIQLEAFLERTLGGVSPVSDPRTLGLMEELQAQLMEQQPYSPMDTSELSFCHSSPSLLHMGLSDPGLDNMEWLDVSTPPGSAGALTPLGIPSDLLDTHQLHWE